MLFALQGQQITKSLTMSHDGREPSPLMKEPGDKAGAAPEKKPTELKTQIGHLTSLLTMMQKYTVAGEVAAAREWYKDLEQMETTLRQHLGPLGQLGLRDPTQA